MPTFPVIEEMHKKLHCNYCGVDLKKEDWHNEWHADEHYKTIHCSCGKRGKVVLEFFSDGNDTWDGRSRDTSYFVKEQKKESDDDLEDTIGREDPGRIIPVKYKFEILSEKVRT